MPNKTAAAQGFALPLQYSTQPSPTITAHCSAPPYRTSLCRTHAGQHETIPVLRLAAQYGAFTIGDAAILRICHTLHCPASPCVATPLLCFPLLCCTARRYAVPMPYIAAHRHYTAVHRYTLAPLDQALLLPCSSGYLFHDLRPGPRAEPDRQRFHILPADDRYFGFNPWDVCPGNHAQRRWGQNPPGPTGRHMEHSTHLAENVPALPVHHHRLHANTTARMAMPTPTSAPRLNISAIPNPTPWAVTLGCS